MEVLGDDGRPPLLPRTSVRLPRWRPPRRAARVGAGVVGAVVVVLALRPADGGRPLEPVSAPTAAPGPTAAPAVRGLLAWPARGSGADDPGLVQEARRALGLWDSGGSLTAVPLWSGDLPDGRRLVVVAADRGRTTVVVTAAGAARLQLVDVDERDPADDQAVRWQDRERDGSAIFTALLPPDGTAEVTVAAVGGTPVSGQPVADTDGLLQVRTGPAHRVTGLVVDGRSAGPEGFPAGSRPLPPWLLELGRVGSGERQLRSEPARVCAVVVREQTRADDEEGECLPLDGEPSLRVDAVGTAPATAARVVVTDARDAALPVVLHTVPGTPWLAWLPPARLDGQVVTATAYDAAGQVIGQARGSL